MDILGELLRSGEHHRHVSKKGEARRKLTKAAKVAVAGTIAVAGIVEGLSLVKTALQGEAKEPNAFLNGRVEIVMSDNLHVRVSPEVHNIIG